MEIRRLYCMFDPFAVVILYCVRHLACGQSCFSGVHDNVSKMNNWLSHSGTESISLSQDWRTKNTLMLFQNLKFRNYGYIESWIGVIYINSSSQNRTDSSIPFMYLQVWRPSKDNTTFTLVGSSPLTLKSISDGTTNSGYLHFKLNISESEDDEIIFFQPKDILGVYISAGVNGAGIAIDANLIMGDMDLTFITPHVECQVSICDESLIMAEPSLPLIFPQCTDSLEWMEESLAVCNRTAMECKMPMECDNCTSIGPQDQVLPGLLLIIVASCVTVVCIVAVVSNTIILCYFRCARRKARQRLQEDRVHRSSCNFIVNPQAVQTDLPAHVRSLAEFLQYNMQYESNISWV